MEFPPAPPQIEGVSKAKIFMSFVSLINLMDIHCKPYRKGSGQSIKTKYILIDRINVKCALINLDIFL